jgi:hypothetical protein
MPLELQIISASEFIRVGPQGAINLEASKKTLELLAYACRKRGLDRALLDLRQLPVPARPALKPAELILLVDTFREAGFGKHHRLAVLYRADPHRRVRAFAVLSRLKGWQVQAFDDFEHALHWLSEEKEKKASPPAGEEVPIRYPKAKAKEKPVRRLVVN